MRLLNTNLGAFTISKNEYNETTLGDTNGKVFFTFEGFYDHEVVKALKDIQTIKSFDELFFLSFYNKIHTSKNVMELVLDMNIEFDTEDYFSEIYEVGMTYIKFDY